jgi:hypothetical protein
VLWFVKNQPDRKQRGIMPVGARSGRRFADREAGSAAGSERSGVWCLRIHGVSLPRRRWSYKSIMLFGWDGDEHPPSQAWFICADDSPCVVSDLTSPPLAASLGPMFGPRFVKGVMNAGGKPVGTLLIHQPPCHSHLHSSFCSQFLTQTCSRGSLDLNRSPCKLWNVAFRKLKLLFHRFQSAGT